MTESFDAHPYTSATVYSAIPMPMKLKTLLMKVLDKSKKAIVNPVRCGYTQRTSFPFGDDERGSSKEEIENKHTPKT